MVSSSADNAGVFVVWFSKDSGDTSIMPISGSSGLVRQLGWSPKSSYLCTHWPDSAKDVDNLHVWRVGKDSKDDVPVASFRFPKQFVMWPILKWSHDEKVCVRFDAADAGANGGKLVITSGHDFQKVLHTVDHERVEAFEFKPKVDGDEGEGYRLAIITRAELKFAKGDAAEPGFVYFYDIKPWNDEYVVEESARLQLRNAEEAEIYWAPSGKSILIHTATAVDDSGLSYYGQSGVYWIRADCKEFQEFGTYTQLELREMRKKKRQEARENGTESVGTETPEEEEDDDMQRQGTVVATCWSPVHDEFVIIQGFQPAVCTMWAVNDDANGCDQTFVFGKELYRNEITWNSNGSLVCLGGFGNLNGIMDFYHRTSKTKYDLVFNTTANQTVTCSWAGDGRHFLTSITAPRRRVDNGIRIWNVLKGTCIVSTNSDELLQASWRPLADSKIDEFDFEEIQESIDRVKALNAAKAQNRYVAPGGLAKRFQDQKPAMRTSTAGNGERDKGGAKGKGKDGKKGRNGFDGKERDLAEARGIDPKARGPAPGTNSADNDGRVPSPPNGSPPPAPAHAGENGTPLSPDPRNGSTPQSVAAKAAANSDVERPKLRFRSSSREGGSAGNLPGKGGGPEPPQGAPPGPPGQGAAPAPRMPPPPEQQEALGGVPVSRYQQGEGHSPPPIPNNNSSHSPKGKGKGGMSPPRNAGGSDPFSFCKHDIEIHSKQSASTYEFPKKTKSFK